MTKFDESGRRVRTTPVPPMRRWPDLNAPNRDAQLLEYAHDRITIAAHYASECMQDHLGDTGVVSDMHNLIGQLGSLRGVIQILESRWKKK